MKLGTRVLRLECGDDAAAVGRRFVVHELETADLADLADAAELAVSELVTNVLLHTDSVPTVSVEISAGSAWVSVQDESPLTPLRGVLHDSALCGRGLVLVERVAQQWGVTRIAGNGKIVWFEVVRGLAAPPEPLSVDELITMWGEPATQDDAIPDSPQLLLCQVRIAGVSAAQLAAARAHIDDLVRDLTMVAAVNTGRETPGLVELAERLRTLLTDLAPLRHGLHATALRGLETHADRVDLELDLDPSLAPAVRDYRQALDTADTYCQRTEMLVCTTTEENVRFRRWYLSEIATQLETCLALRARN